MGHLTNPLGFRLGRSMTWVDKWVCNPLCFKSLLVSQNSVHLYFSNVLVRYLRRYGVVYSHLAFRRRPSGYSICLYLYSSTLLLFQKAKFLKYVKNVSFDFGYGLLGNRRDNFFLISSPRFRLRLFKLRKRKLRLGLPAVFLKNSLRRVSCCYKPK